MAQGKNLLTPERDPARAWRSRNVLPSDRPTHWPTASEHGTDRGQQRRLGAAPEARRHLPTRKQTEERKEAGELQERARENARVNAP